jgi:hypothetical protein
MTEPQFPAPSLAPSPGEGTSTETLRRQLQSLRMMFVAALMALLILTVGVDFYLWYQVKTVRRDLNTNYAFLAFLEDYQKNREPMLNKLVTGLQSLAQSHPDLTPMLEKYNIKLPAIDPVAPAASAPAATSLPAEK